MSRHYITQFSIFSLFLLTLFVAIVVRLWPESTAESDTIDTGIERNQTTQFFPDSVFELKKWTYGSNRFPNSHDWKCERSVPGDGNSIWLILSSHIIGTFDGGGMTWISVQLPSELEENDEIALVPIEYARNTGANGETSLMKSGEISIFVYGNPMYNDFLRESDCSSAGTLKILAINQSSIKIAIEIDKIIDSDELPLNNVFDIPVNRSTQSRTNAG